MCGRAGSATQAGTTTASTGYTLLRQQLPINQACKDVPDGYKERKHSGENVQQGKIRYHPKSREREAEGKRQKQLLLYLHPTKLCREQSLLHRSRPWTGEAFPKVKWTRRIGTRRGTNSSQGKLGTPLGPSAWLSRRYKLNSLLFLTLLENLISVGAVASE